MKPLLRCLVVGLLVAGILAGCGPAPTPVKVTVKETVQVPVEVTRVVEKKVEVAAPATAPRQWKLVNPEGVVVVKPVEIAPRIASLEGKTVLLRWNGKHNGNNFLDRIAELMTQQIKGVKIIKMWEAVPGSNGYPMQQAHFDAAMKLKPDIVIGSQAD